MIDIADDLSVHVVSDDGARELRLPSYDPRTMIPFASRDEAAACALAMAAIPEAWSPVPTPEERLARAKAAKIAAITSRADALMAAGYPHDGLHVRVDDGSRADLTAMAATAIAAAAGALPWPESYALGWISIENIRIPLATPAAGLALAAGAGGWYAAIVQHRRSLKDATLSAGDEAAVAAIDETAGWPE